MDNWENNLMANKLNSLQGLPEGYTPNLASKWEIIEAGLPKEKRIVPLFKWAAAAAALVGLILIGLILKPFFNNPTIAMQLPHTNKHFLFTETIILKPKQKTIIIHSINAISINNNKLFVANHLIKSQQSHRLNKKLIALDTTPVLLNTPPIVAILPTTIAPATLITVNTLQPTKLVKRKTYQKDFNDNLLKAADNNTASQIKQPGLKFQFTKPETIHTDQPSSPILQWQKSF